MYYCKAIWKGIEVFVELTDKDLYESSSSDEELTVFEDRNCQIFLHQAKISELEGIIPE